MSRLLDADRDYEGAMGLLVDGRWQDRWYRTDKSGGRFQRRPSTFREELGSQRFPVESGRYALIVSYACPWAHRTLIYRALFGLEAHLPLHVVEPLMLEKGWTFGEPLWGADCLHQLYTRANPTFTGRVTVPVLWDTQTGTIVNNESSELIRMFSAFDGLGGNTLDFRPEALVPAIDAINERVYSDVNNGVYKCGFASTQSAYDAAVHALFEALDWLEAILAEQPFLAGDRVTEADWRLLTTLLRFDEVYVTHFKCDRRRIVDYSNLWAYTRQLLQVPGVAETFRLDHIRSHYFQSHRAINPHGIISIGPQLDWEAPHGRGPVLETART